MVIQQPGDRWIDSVGLEQRGREGKDQLTRRELVPMVRPQDPPVCRRLCGGGQRESDDRTPFQAAPDLKETYPIGMCPCQ